MSRFGHNSDSAVDCNCVVRTNVVCIDNDKRPSNKHGKFSFNIFITGHVLGCWRFSFRSGFVISLVDFGWIPFALYG